MITVVVPTIAGREDHYRRCVEAYETRSRHPLQIVTVADRPTCGIAWNEGAAQAAGDFLHFTADDLEPLAGWDDAAVAAVGAGMYPAARIDRPDGTTRWYGCNTTATDDGSPVRAGWVPFMTAAMWQRIGPSLDTHYGTDDWLSWRAAMEGFPNVYVSGFAFVHHHAMPGRGAGMDERQRRRLDARALEEAQRTVRRDHDGRRM